MKILLVFPALLVLGYASICVLLYLNQDRLLFFPAHATAAELETRAKQIGLEPWTNLHGERIGWKSPEPAENALLFCHGNGGFALSEGHANLCHAGAAEFQVFLLEYPGYGARPGKISTQALTDAAIDAIDTLAAGPSPAGDPSSPAGDPSSPAGDPQSPAGGSKRPIWLLGESLGSGIASAATAARPDKISGLILDTPFDSLSAAASSHYPWLPVRLLLRHRLDSDRNLERYHGPVAFIVAGNDTTIPPHHAERLYHEYAGPKRLWLVPGAGHNDFDALFAEWPQIVAWLLAPGSGIQRRESKVP